MKVHHMTFTQKAAQLQLSSIRWDTLVTGMTMVTMWLGAKVRLS